MGGTATSFTVVMIKPSRYDDEGYPITWYRSIIPSNTLAALYGLGRDCERRTRNNQNFRYAHASLFSV